MTPAYRSIWLLLRACPTALASALGRACLSRLPALPLRCCWRELLTWLTACPPALPVPDILPLAEWGCAEEALLEAPEAEPPSAAAAGRRPLSWLAASASFLREAAPAGPALPEREAEPEAGAEPRGDCRAAAAEAGLLLLLLRAAPAGVPARDSTPGVDTLTVTSAGSRAARRRLSSSRGPGLRSTEAGLRKAASGSCFFFTGPYMTSCSRAAASASCAAFLAAFSRAMSPFQRGRGLNFVRPRPPLLLLLLLLLS